VRHAGPVDVIRHRAAVARGDLVHVADAMTPLVIALPASTPVPQAARYMLELRVHRILVEDDDGEPVGIVSTTDITELVASQASDEPTQVHVHGRHPGATTPREVFLASLARVERDPEFADAFYLRVQRSSPQIAHALRHADPDTQKRKLMASFRLAADAVVGEPEALERLAEQARVHDRHHRNISPDLYPRWIDALVDTVRRRDPRFDIEVEVAWRVVLGHVAYSMIRRY